MNFFLISVPVFHIFHMLRIMRKQESKLCFIGWFLNIVFKSYNAYKACGLEDGQRQETFYWGSVVFFLSFFLLDDVNLPGSASPALLATATLSLHSLRSDWLCKTSICRICND